MEIAGVANDLFNTGNRLKPIEEAGFVSTGEKRGPLNDQLPPRHAVLQVPRSPNISQRDQVCNGSNRALSDGQTERRLAQERTSRQGKTDVDIRATGLRL